MAYVIEVRALSPLVPLIGASGMSSAGGPGLVVLVAVGFEAGAHPVEEAGEGVAVPFLEAVAIEGEADPAALIGQERQFVN